MRTKHPILRRLRRDLMRLHKEKLAGAAFQARSTRYDVAARLHHESCGVAWAIEHLDVLDEELKEGK